MLWVVAAPGSSLSIDVAEQCRGYRVIAVNDAYKRLPFARCLYAADIEWWKARAGAPEFRGEKWTVGIDRYLCLPEIKQFGLNMIPAAKGAGFCFEPNLIHLGGNSGFQAVNLAITFGGTRVVMVGFDMKGNHFFGDHERPLRQKFNFDLWLRKFKEAADMLPAHINIINATPDSALKAFPMMTLNEALNAENRDA